jgi:hypothetical protein
LQEFKEVIAFYDGAVDLDVRVQVARLSKKFIGFSGGECRRTEVVG